MSRKPKPEPRKVGRPAVDHSLIYIHMEALHRLQCRSLNQIMTDTRPSDLLVRIDGTTIMGEPVKLSTLRRRFYRFRQQLMAADAATKADFESLIQGMVEFLRSAKEGPITAQ